MRFLKVQMLDIHSDEFVEESLTYYSDKYEESFLSTHQQLKERIKIPVECNKILMGDYVRKLI